MAHPILSVYITNPAIMVLYVGHLFAECRAWAPQIRKLWRRVGKECGWKRLRVPSVRWMWEEETTEAVLEFLEDRSSAMVAIGPQEEGARAQRRRRPGRACPRLYFPWSFPLFFPFVSIPFSFVRRPRGSRRSGCPGMTRWDWGLGMVVYKKAHRLLGQRDSRYKETHTQSTLSACLLGPSSLVTGDNPSLDWRNPPEQGSLLGSCYIKAAAAMALQAACSRL